MSVTAALWEYIGTICHIYLNNIVIWSDDVVMHTKHVDLIMALHEAQLYCNPTKCNFYHDQINFLGHTISINGIEPNSSKIKHILQWPTPESAIDICRFLGLVHYISTFLPKLADYTVQLTPLTTKAAHNSWPEWTMMHQWAFDGIKALVVSTNVILWNGFHCKVLYYCLYFYIYKLVILHSQIHQKKLERIDEVDEGFWPLLPSDTGRKEEIESDNGKRKYGTGPFSHETCTNLHPEPLEVSKWSMTYPQDPSPQPSVE
jgi:hypothetical protein